MRRSLRREFDVLRHDPEIIKVEEVPPGSDVWPTSVLSERKLNAELGSTSCQGLSGWFVFDGTSVSSPSLAGIVNFGRALLRQFVGVVYNLRELYEQKRFPGHRFRLRGQL
jgi:hypothetical protein